MLEIASTTQPLHIVTMADPKNIALFTQEQLDGAYGDKEKPISPDRSLCSCRIAALFPSAGDKGQKPPSLPGQKFPAKRQPYKQALLMELPSSPPTQQLLLSPPHAMPAVAGAVTTTPRWHLTLVIGHQQ
jgi:hypothetical protein